jgi:transcriptional regulator with XRE-family HTH domain
MEPIDLKTIGENIRKHRKARQIKQEWLAHKIGLNKSEISRLETGQRDTTIKILIEIATVLEIEPADLFIK